METAQAANKQASPGVSLKVTQAEFARMNDWSDAYVSKLVKQKKIEKVDGKIDFEKAMRALNRQADPAREMAIAAKATAPANTEAPTGAAADDQEGAGAQSDSFYEARTEREKYQALSAKLKYEKDLGQYLDKSEVVNSMIMAGRKIRQSMDAIIEWADEIAAITSAGGGAEDVKKFLKTRVRSLQQQTSEMLVEQNIDNSAVH